MPVGRKSTHKNAIRSRRLIKQAFAELLNEKDISKITVTNIVERANISRGTFYAHYLDVYDLYNAIQSNIVEAVQEIFKRIGVVNILKDPSDIIRSGIQFLNKNKYYYRLFITSLYGEIFINRITTITEEKLKDIITKIFTEDEVKMITYHIFYTVGAIKNILLHWFNEDLNLSSDECANYIITFYLNNRPEIISKKVNEYIEG